MSVVHFLVTVILFVLLTPAVLVRLPPKGSKWTVALVHGVVFATVIHVVYLYVLPNLPILEELTSAEIAKKNFESSQKVAQNSQKQIQKQADDMREKQKQSMNALIQKQIQQNNISQNNIKQQLINIEKANAKALNIAKAKSLTLSQEN